jgi:hypothetical protein
MFQSTNHWPFWMWISYDFMGFPAPLDGLDMSFFALSCKATRWCCIRTEANLGARHGYPPGSMTSAEMDRLGDLLSC